MSSNQSHHPKFGAYAARPGTYDGPVVGATCERCLHRSTEKFAGRRWSYCDAAKGKNAGRSAGAIDPRRAACADFKSRSRR